MAKILSMEVFKKRPVLTTSIVVIGGLVVYLLFFRGGGQSSTANGESYTDANVNAASSLANMQNSPAAMQAQQIQGQLAALQIQGANEIGLASTQANLQRDIAAFSLEAAKLDHVRDMYGLQVQENIEELGIEKTAQIEQLKVSSELEALKAQTNAQVQLQQIITQGNVSLAQQAAAVSIAGINTTALLSKYSYDAQIALGAQDVRKTELQVGGQKYIAGKQASASKTSTWVQGVIAIASLFCDRHIKSIDGCVNSEKCLNAIREMPVEFWHYIEGSEPHDSGDTAQHVNTYSQDFYRTLGAHDWESRKKIAIVDYMGALTGAVKALDKKAA
jgi:hypothetical protein